ncbi:E3 ubiquitin-protein ligase ZSWIM2-like [Liolophura sinensis]|uniref:E3 ubiquitin-protein ligase ZSWIM2-like n=1 Tax=Liolophura sinensis TaxID=3198878 RepID=UPI003158492E
MSRSVAWRRAISDAASWRQDQALNATMYILRQTGPTGFLLKEEGETKKFKVYLGDPHKCSCSVFGKEKDVCKHICWLLLKKYRVPRHDPVSWQLGLVEREINAVLRGQMAPDATRARQRHTPVHKKLITNAADGRTVLEQKEISEEDVCPICQEELLEKKLPVTFCKFGCGNSIHIKCMKVWAEHQKSQGETTIKCPLCREDFGPFELLRQEGRNADQTGRGTGSHTHLDRHLGTTCRACHMNPIIGKCYRCCVCADYHLCQACFNTPIHTDHAFQFRQKRNQRWRPAQRTLGFSLPEAVMNDLLNREISENDYDLLLQLDSQGEAGLRSVPEEALELFPLERVRESSQCLAPGVQCRMCLRGYQVGQYLRKLPCKHKFHRDCIDPWLLHSHVTCPVDGQVVWTPSDQHSETGEMPSTHGQLNRREGSVHSDPGHLEIPGVGLARLHSLGSRVRGPASPSQSEPSSHRPRPTIPNYRDGEVPTGLSGILFGLNGTALTGNSGPSGEITTSSRNHESDSILGNRLLARARIRRKRISQQLANIPSERIHVDPVAPSIPAPHGLDGISAGFSTSQCAGAQGPRVAGRPPKAQTTPDGKCIRAFLMLQVLAV